MLCIFDPLICGFTKVLGYQLFTSNFEVKRKGNEKVSQGNMTKKRFEKFQEFGMDVWTLPRIIAKTVLVSKHLSTNFKILLKQSLAKKIHTPRLILKRDQTFSNRLSRMSQRSDIQKYIIEITN